MAGKATRRSIMQSISRWKDGKLDMTDLQLLAWALLNRDEGYSMATQAVLDDEMPERMALKLWGDLYDIMVEWTESYWKGQVI